MAVSISISTSPSSTPRKIDSNDAVVLVVGCVDADKTIDVTNDSMVAVAVSTSISPSLNRSRIDRNDVDVSVPVATVVVVPVAAVVAPVIDAAAAAAVASGGAVAAVDSIATVGTAAAASGGDTTTDGVMASDEFIVTVSWVGRHETKTRDEHGTGTVRVSSNNNKKNWPWENRIAYGCN